jgi:hypothetical protein
MNVMNLQIFIWFVATCCKYYMSCMACLFDDSSGYGKEAKKTQPNIIFMDGGLGGKRRIMNISSIKRIQNCSRFFRVPTSSKYHLIL